MQLKPQEEVRVEANTSAQMQKIKMIKARAESDKRAEEEALEVGRDEGNIPLLTIPLCI